MTTPTDPPPPSPVPAPTPVSTPTPTSTPTPVPHCANCNDHSARCFKDDAATAISSGPNRERSDGEIKKYFDLVMTVEEGDPAPTLQKGDLVLWPGHSGVATGQGDTISQCGSSIDHWRARRTVQSKLSQGEIGELSDLLEVDPLKGSQWDPLESTCRHASLSIL